jgi:TolB protein
MIVCHRRRDVRSMRAWAVAMAAAALGVGIIAQQGTAPAALPPDSAKETHLANVRQLTFGGENAEAYFSFDGKDLSFQTTRDGAECDQIYAMHADGTGVRRISNGEGRTTCSFFTPDKQHIIYASTYLAGKACPPKPDFSRGYVWPVYASYDIMRARADGSGIQRLTTTPGYDAEGTIGRDGRIVFTSVRDGDMEIYSMSGDGSDVRRLTHRPGPDGGPFFSADGTRIVFRGRTLPSGPELDDYMALLRDGVWRPTSLEIFVMNRDGTGLRQVTSLGAASFAPFFTPDGTRIIFASNHPNPRGRDFEIWLINVDGSGLERVTWNPSFDGFPMFSPNGRQLVFASNRNQKTEGETNVFIADWR